MIKGITERDQHIREATTKKARALIDLNIQHEHSGRGHRIGGDERKEPKPKRR